MTANDAYRVMLQIVASLTIIIYNGRESTVNRALDGTIYSGYKLAPFSQKIILLGAKKHNNLYLRLVTPSSG